MLRGRRDLVGEFYLVALDPPSLQQAEHRHQDDPTWAQHPQQLSSASRSGWRGSNTFRGLVKITPKAEGPSKHLFQCDCC